jgi:hypothetical protein
MLSPPSLRETEGNIRRFHLGGKIQKDRKEKRRKMWRKTEERGKMKKNRK